jgi:hypothetical protein
MPAPSQVARTDGSAPSRQLRITSSETGRFSRVSRRTSTAWFCGREAAVPVPDFLRAVFERARGQLSAAIYPPLGDLPVLAGPGFVDLYRRVIGGVLREVAQATGREAALAMLERGQGIASMEHPPIAAFEITAEGRVTGDPVASPDALTAGIAAWMTEALIAASDHHGVDPGAVMERVGRDSRFVLQEHGFFNRLPWALAI